MNKTKNRIVSHSAIYLTGDIMRRSVSLIMLPIYTRYLTPEDYGVVELLSMLLDFASILFGARVSQAVFRFYCTASSQKEKNSIISSALILDFLLNAAGALAVAIFSTPLSIAIFGSSEYSSLIALFALTLFFLPLVEIPLTHIRAQQKPWLFTIFSLMKLFLQLSLNIYLVVIHEMHVEGVIYSAVISSAIMAVILTVYSLSVTGIKVTKKAVLQLFSFSLPLKLATFGTFYVTFGDRYILNIYTNLTQVGIYSLGYKFGFMFTLLAWTPFERMWDSEKYEIYNKPDARAVFQKVFLYISFVMIFIALGMSLFTKDLLKIMSDPAFLEAYKVVPIIISAYIIQAWTKYVNLGILINKKTMEIAYAEIVAVLAITAAYFLLIPTFGIYGAAWATVIGFAARFFWTNWKAKQYYDMELPWGKVGITAVLALLAFAFSLLVPESVVISIALRSFIVLSFIMAFFTLPILPQDEKNEIKDKISFFVKNRRLKLKRQK